MMKTQSKQFLYAHSIARRVGERVGHNKLFKDKIFQPEDWAIHKTWLRFLPQPSTSLRVLWGFGVPVLFMVIWTVFVCLYHAWLVKEGAPDFWNKNIYLYQAFSLSSFCLSLLLVHRTTATYNRWWEARTVWGQVTNVSRNLVRVCASTSGFSPKDRPLLEMLARCSIAMSYLLRAHLNHESAKKELEPILMPEELNFILVSPQPCLRLAQIVSSIVGRGLPGSEQQQMRVYADEQIQLYVNDVGACERIHRTAVPSAFTRHLCRFLMIWLFFLPFALWPIAGWASPVVEFLLAYLLMGTENIGIQIEEPFCIMTLSVFCAGCEDSIVEIMRSYSDATSLVDAEISGGVARGYSRNPSIPLEPDPEDDVSPGTIPSFTTSPFSTTVKSFSSKFRRSFQPHEQKSGISDPYQSPEGLTPRAVYNNSEHRKEDEHTGNGVSNSQV